MSRCCRPSLIQFHPQSLSLNKPKKDKDKLASDMVELKDALRERPVYLEVVRPNGVNGFIRKEGADRKDRKN